MQRQQPPPCKELINRLRERGLFASNLVHQGTAHTDEISILIVFDYCRKVVTGTFYTRLLLYFFIWET